MLFELNLTILKFKMLISFVHTKSLFLFHVSKRTNFIINFCIGPVSNHFLILTVLFHLIF